MKRSVKKVVQERASKKICLIDGCGCTAIGRGLCPKHKNKFYYELSRIKTDIERLEFEQRCINEGIVLPMRDTLLQEQGVANPFREMRTA